MPNDVLINILERLDSPDAVRACSLSKKMAKLPTMLSRIDLDVHYFAYVGCGSGPLPLSDVIRTNGHVTDATDRLLTFRNQQVALRHLSLRFYLRYYDCLTIGKAVSQAMATHNLDTAEFTILTEKQGEDCGTADIVYFGKLFKTFLATYPDVFAGITRLELQNLHIAQPDIYNMLSTCKRLNSLQLCCCLVHTDQAVLQIEHPQLVELQIIYGDFELVELKCLPKLKRMAYWHWDTYEDPLSFGDVPLLSSLRLTNAGAGWQKNLRFSQFLSNVTSISELDLNFESEKIWVHPECPKLLGPVFHKLQRVGLVDLPEGCDIDWTVFILEAAPSLKELCITVWDHWCNIKSEDERREQGYDDKTNVEWESSAPDGFRHENLAKLTIYGFQSDENLVRYVRRLMEVAVDLEEISLYDRKVCESCGDLDPKIKVKISPSRYPCTMEEEELIKKQIIEGLGMVSLDVIHFRS